MRSALLLAVTTAGTLLGGGAAEAQTWSLEARAGRLYAEPAVGMETSTALVSLRRAAPESVFGAAAGVPLRREDPVWGVLSAWQRTGFDLGPVTLGVDLSGELFGQQDRAGRDLGDDMGGGLLGRRPPLSEESLDGWAASGEVMPRAAVGFGEVELEARAGVAAHRSDVAGSLLERTLRAGDARLTWAPTTGFAVAATGRMVRTEEGDFSRFGVSAARRTGPLTLRGSAGAWSGHEDVEGLEWSAEARLGLSDRLELTVQGHRSRFDPLRLTPGRTSWGVGLAWSFGGPDAPAPPVPSEYRDGRATLTLDEDDAGPAPRIAGDFTDWEPRPMERTDDGWRYRVALEPGVYNYAFVGSDGEWFVPPSVPGRKPDGFGGWVAVLVVEEQG